MLADSGNAAILGTSILIVAVNWVSFTFSIGGIAFFWGARIRRGARWFVLAVIAVGYIGKYTSGC